MPELTLRAKPSDQIKIHNAWGGKMSEERNYSIDSGVNMLMAFFAPIPVDGFARTVFLRRVLSVWKDSAAAPSPICAGTLDHSHVKRQNQQGPMLNAQGQN